MAICDDCKHNRGNRWCKFFNATLISMGEVSPNCVGYRKITGKTNDIKKRSIKQEKNLAKDIGAKRTPKSGAEATDPSDMIKGKYVIESKATSKKSINLKKEWLEQLKCSPINYGKIPTLIIEFSKDNRYVILDIEDFKRIIE